MSRSMSASRRWQRNALEVALERSRTFRTGGMQLCPNGAHSLESRIGVRCRELFVIGQSE